MEKVGTLLTTRNFIIRNAAGEVMGHATSEWALINLTSRRPMNLSADTEIAACATGEPEFVLTSAILVSAAEGLLSHNDFVCFFAGF